MRILPWSPLRTVPDDDGTEYVFRTTEEDLSGTTATKGKVAEIATESMTTFDRILIGAQEVRATRRNRPGNEVAPPITVEWGPDRPPLGKPPVRNAQLSPLLRRCGILVLKTEMTDAPDRLFGRREMIK